MKRELMIDSHMKELWPAARVGCIQYQVKVKDQNEDMWKFLKKDIYKMIRDEIFDYGIGDIPNVQESRQAYKAFGKDPSRYRVSSEAMITENASEVLTLIYSFSANQDLEKALEYGREYLEQYADARDIESWIVG